MQEECPGWTRCNALPALVHGTDCCSAAPSSSTIGQTALYGASAYGGCPGIWL